VFLVKYNILLLSASETQLLNNIISHAVIKFYTYFACCFNYRQLFWALLSDAHKFSASVPRHPETSTSPIGLYSAGLTDQCAWDSVSDLQACVGFRDIKKVEKHWLTYLNAQCTRPTVDLWLQPKEVAKFLNA